MAMRNANLQRDFNNLKGYDDTADNVLTQAEKYISFLEGQENRLRVMEGALNNVDDSKIENKAEFLKFFKELKIDA